MTQAPLKRKDKFVSWLTRCKLLSLQNIKKIMEGANAKPHTLRSQILETEAQLKRLKEELAQVEASGKAQTGHDSSVKENSVAQGNGQKWPLSTEEYQRYGRQMIVPSIGILGFYYLSSYVAKCLLWQANSGSSPPLS